MQQDYRSRYGAHVAEVQARWEQAMEAEGLEAIVVHSGTPITSFLDDYEYAFRPNPHFLAWLPLTHHSDSVLLLRPGRRPLLYFYQPVDYWYLPPADPEPWWADHFDIEVMRDANGWRAALERVLPPAAGRATAIGDAPSLQAAFAAEDLNPTRLLDRLHLARTRKTGYEVACIEAAESLAARAHVAAEQAFREGGTEFEIHMRYLAVCEERESELPYFNIVALNDHGAVLHYQSPERAAPPRRLSFLIDAGATVNAYASDITRSYAAAPGAFAELIAGMEALQQELAGTVRPGLDYRDLHLRAHHLIAELLLSSGIIRVGAEEAVESGLSGVFFPHGLGHFIGLQTHDVAGLIDNEGRPIPRPDGHPFLRLTRVLEAGNVLTIEPGLYFIEPLLANWRANGDAAAIDWGAVDALAPYGGIRIEDNVLVSAEGGINLTRKAFADLC